MRNSPAAMVLLFTAVSAVPAIAASVRGSVVDGVSGAPVPRAQVTLMGQVNGKPVRYGATAGADGGFSFDGVSVGEYDGLAARPGYVDQSGVPEGRADVHIERAEDNKVGVVIKLTPTGSITGRVTDADGAPVEDAWVSAESVHGGGSATTDEKGAFRIGGLAPGKFRVRASLGSITSLDKPEIRMDGTAEVYDASSYYPGVLEIRQASRVSVQAGTETGGVDIRLVRVPFVRVSGRVAGVPEGIRANLAVHQTGGVSSVGLRADNKFELWRLPPGSYVFSADWMAAGGEHAATGPVAVDVGSSNIDGIDLHAVAPSTISGHVEFGDEDARKSVEPGKPGRVELSTEYGGFRDAPIREDGTFQLKRVPAGVYRIRVEWGNNYIKTIRLGSAAEEPSNLDLSNGSGGADLWISVAEAKSSIAGMVQGSSEARAGVAVFLLSNDGPENNRRTEIKPDGSYSLEHVPPGHYRITAAPEADQVELFYDRNAADESQMDEVEPGTNDRITKDLKAPAK